MNGTATLSHAGFGARVADALTAGVLSWTDVHVADRLARWASVTEEDTDTLVACALAVRAVRLGHTGVALSAPALPAGALAPLPDGPTWRARLAASPLVGTSPDEPRPFVLTGDLLQTARMARYEDRLARALHARASSAPLPLPPAAAVAAAVDRWFPGVAVDDRQRLAAVLALRARTTVISGGPGTGKTTTIRKVLLTLGALARDAGAPLPVVQLAAPTGKAAARMRDALVGKRPDGVDDALWAWLTAVEARTLHRMLGFQPANPTRFAHGPSFPLPAEVVIVDEASMIDVALLCKLVEAVAPSARLVLLGDRDQLASVEAGCALADLTAGAGRAGIRLPPVAAADVSAILGDAAVAGRVDPTAPALAEGMVHLTRSYRFENEVLRAPIAALAEASAADDPAVEARWLGEARDRLVRPDGEQIRHLPHDGGAVHPEVIASVVAQYHDAVKALVARPRDPAERRDVHARVEAVRVLCAHRSGRLGASGLNAQITAGLADALGVPAGHRRPGGWTGQLVQVTENDAEHGLWNGDVGVVVRIGGVSEVVFAGVDGGLPRAVPWAAMPRHQPAFAMTIHKSQGSQFACAVVVLPSEASPILTRELVYTGISRAQQSLIWCGDPAILDAAIQTRVRRDSGLAHRLWGR